MSLMFDPNMVRPKPVSKDREIVLGSITIIAGLLGFFLWAVFSPLHEGVVATGSGVVESHRKIVQHLEGGLVKAVLVKEGSVVKKDDILVEMEGTQARANLDIVTGRYWSALALLTRLEAIYNNQLSLVFPPDLLAAAKGNEKLTAPLNAQREIFRIYQEQYANQYRIYQERVAALTDQQRAKQTYLGNMKQELGNLETLEKDRLIDQSSLIARQRDYQETKSDVNRLGSEIAASRLSLTQLKIDTMDKASRDMAEARKELNDLKLQKDNLQDVVDRTQVRSPADGTVLRLAISSSGQVVPPGGALMEIVPLDDR
ncbi:MAG: biotin/lipoyl-binding protein, partial [Alphaproteobacteria bacterium]|nr:biotin/lipoyl-binding protein [Alphaproteobacteria bacterium]